MLLIRAIKNSEVPIFFSLNGWSFDGKSTCPVAVQSWHVKLTTLSPLTVPRKMWDHADTDQGRSWHWVSGIELLQGHLQSSEAVHDRQSHDRQIRCCQGEQQKSLGDNSLPVTISYHWFWLGSPLKTKNCQNAVWCFISSSCSGLQLNSFFQSLSTQGIWTEGMSVESCIRCLFIPEVSVGWGCQNCNTGFVWICDFSTKWHMHTCVVTFGLWADKRWDMHRKKNMSAEVDRDFTWL